MYDINDNTLYYYKISEFVTTFGKDLGQNEPFSNEIEFKGRSFLESREEAIRTYKERLEGFAKEGKYFLPLARKKGFKFGKNAAYSINLYLVQVDLSTGEEFEMVIAGESPEEMREGIELDVRLLAHHLNEHHE